MKHPNELTEIGESMFCHIRSSDKAGKVSLELAEIVASATSPFAILNASDPRFKKGKPQRAWLYVEVQDAIKYFPDLEKALIKCDSENRDIQIEHMNPTLLGERLQVQIIESDASELTDEAAELDPLTQKKKIEHLEKMLSEPEKYAKRLTSDGPFLLINGLPIFRESTVVNHEPVHRLLQHTSKVYALEGIKNGVILAEPVRRFKKEPKPFEV